MKLFQETTTIKNIQERCPIIYIYIYINTDKNLEMQCWRNIKGALKVEYPYIRMSCISVGKESRKYEPISPATIGDKFKYLTTKAVIQ